MPFPRGWLSWRLSEVHRDQAGRGTGPRLFSPPWGPHKSELVTGGQGLSCLGGQHRGARGARELARGLLEAGGSSSHCVYPPSFHQPAGPPALHPEEVPEPGLGGVETEQALALTSRGCRPNVEGVPMVDSEGMVWGHPEAAVSSGLRERVTSEWGFGGSRRPSEGKVGTRPSRALWVESA